MSKPTCWELLDYVGHGGDPETLVARVERVLAMERIDYAASDQAGGYNDCLAEVKRLLDGEEP